MNDKIDKMLIKKIRPGVSVPPITKYDIENTWGYFLWWREQFFDEF